MPLFTVIERWRDRAHGLDVYTVAVWARDRIGLLAVLILTLVFFAAYPLHQSRYPACAVMLPFFALCAVIVGPPLQRQLTRW